MKKTKIDWCDCTINPVIGCKNGCPYCYAKKINERFKFIENWNKPKFFPERLDQLKSKKPKSIFMDSMSDVGWWNLEWIKKTAKAIKQNPQHNYLFLTKRPDLFIEKCKSIEEASNGNVFIGTTISRRCEIQRVWNLPAFLPHFISIEPILEDFGDISNTDLVSTTMGMGSTIIIGAETGNRKDKVIPKKEWILNIVDAVNKANDEYIKSFGSFGWEHAEKHNRKIKIFMKESLRELMGEDFRQDQLIWAVK